MTRFSRLRVRLLLVVLLAVIPALGLILYTGLEQRRLAALSAQQDGLRLARLAALEQNQLIEGARQLLIGLAQLPAVVEPDGRGCSALFSTILRQFPVYTNLLVARPSGEVSCSAVPFQGSVNLADRPYFQQAMKMRRLAISDYMIGRITGKANLAMAHPSIDQSGAVRAVVILGLDLRWLNHLAADAQLPRDSTLFVVDRAGVVLASYPDADTWVGRAVPDAPVVKAILNGRADGMAETLGLDGVPRLFAFARLPGPLGSGEVFISVGIPRIVAFAEANRMLARNLIGLGVVGLLALAGAWIAGGRLILRPVNALVSATKRLGAGDLSVRTRLPHKRGELGQLALAFDQMVESLERQRDGLVRSEKMAALGRLAAGVAHELRNPLMVIDGRSQLLKHLLAQEQTQLPAVDHLSRSVASVQEAAGRMRRIMEGLSNYSRPPKRAPMLLCMSELLSATRELMAGQAKKSGVTISVDAPETLPEVWGDRSQLTQVLVNLADNAIEAMAHTGGRLALNARLRGEGTEERVRVEVADTGPGIPPEVLPKVWEAFYTSKPEGTGLGLSIVRELVAEQPGATIDVESRPGQGTTFILTMPVAGAPSPADVRNLGEEEEGRMAESTAGRAV